METISEKQEKKQEKEKEKRKMREQKKKENLKRLKREHQKFQEKINQLIRENEEMKRKIEELESKQTSEFHVQILKNLKILLKDFPQNSPFRRPFLSYLCQNVEKTEFKKAMKISETTWQRIKELDGGQLISIEYPVNVTRERITEKQKDEIRRILNEILPVCSGRDFRYQEETDDKIYQEYCRMVKKGEPVSKTFFVYTILTHELIHHSKKPKFCKLCEKYDECISKDQEVPEKLIHHKELILLQRGTYALQKKRIAEGKAKETVLITQDFTQLEFDGGFVQDLIICCYDHDSNAKDGLKRSYRHFVGDIGDSNQISFVAGCWIELLKGDWFHGKKIVEIWSDGGGKHFKISSNIGTIKAIQDEYDEIDWIYNFFPSYHGCNVCDAVGSQAKRVINEYMRNTKQAIRSQEQVINAINSLKNHHATPARLLKEMNFTCSTLNGIKSYHKFLTRPRNFNVYAFNDSNDDEYAFKWPLQQIFSLKTMSKC